LQIRFIDDQLKRRIINELPRDYSNFENYQVFDVYSGLYVRAIEKTKSANHGAGEFAFTLQANQPCFLEIRDIVSKHKHVCSIHGKFDICRELIASYRMIETAKSDFPSTCRA
jgi:hypothetical protein